MNLEQKPGSIFVTLPDPTQAKMSDAESRLTVKSDAYQDTWEGVADHMKSLFTVSTPTEKDPHAHNTPRANQPASSLQAPKVEPKPEPKVETLADSVRCYRISHFDGSQKSIYEGVYTSDIPGRCQAYASKSGFLVRLVCDQPHELKTFQPNALRENPNCPPVVDPDAPPQMPLEKLSWQAQADGGMFLDDRRGTTRRGRRMHDRKIVAWLNRETPAGWYVKIRLPDVFGSKPIPRSILSLDGAVEFVLRNSYWVEGVRA